MVHQGELWWWIIEFPMEFFVIWSFASLISRHWTLEEHYWFQLKYKVIQEKKIKKRRRGADLRSRSLWLAPAIELRRMSSDRPPPPPDHMATIVLLSMVFWCVAIVDTLPYEYALLEKSLAFMGSVEDQWKMIPKGALVCHPKDLLPPWRDSAGLFQRCEGIVLSLVSTISIIRDIPSMLAHTISWHPPDEGITLV